MTVAVIIAVIWLAYSNGANDNFKGVATLYGSGTASFNRARFWATLTTVAGSLVSVALSSSLAKQFTGSGLVPAALAQDSVLLVSVGGAGAATVLLATVLGLPTSTTHALTGALVGVALLVNGGIVPLGKLWSGFFAPLLISPALAVVLAAGSYAVLRRIRVAAGVAPGSCICVGPSQRQVAAVLSAGATGMSPAETHTSEASAVALGVTVGQTASCAERYSGQFLGITAQDAMGTVHYLSAGSVCFARAVNDTPKIAALLMVGGALAGWKLTLVAAAMAIGGVIQARKVAETMSKRIATLDSGHGLAGNLVTAALVLGASRLGVPVSTTHVSVGSILGVGLVSGRSQWKTIGQIATAWIVTLPLGGLLGAASYFLLSRAR